MSHLSSQSGRSQRGFAPYSSGDVNAKELSLFSRLNLNDYN